MAHVHCSDVIIDTMASQITSLTIVYSTAYSGAHQRKKSKLRVTGLLRGIHRGPVNSPHKWPVTPKMFPFDDVIMHWRICVTRHAWVQAFAIVYLLVTSYGDIDLRQHWLTMPGCRQAPSHYMNQCWFLSLIFGPVQLILNFFQGTMIEILPPLPPPPKKKRKIKINTK